MSLILLLTQSRGAYLAVLVVGLGLVTSRWRFGWLSLPAVGLLTVVVLLQFDTVQLFNFLAGSRGISSRLEIWQRAMLLIRDFPFTGVGMGLYEDAAWLLYPFSEGTKQAIAQAHNLYLQIAVDLGVPGLFAWLVIFGMVFKACWQVFKSGTSSEDPFLRGFSAGMLAGLSAVAIHGVMDAVVWGMIRAAPLVWGFWGIGISAWYILDVKNTDSAHASR